MYGVDVNFKSSLFHFKVYNTTLVIRLLILTMLFLKLKIGHLLCLENFQRFRLLFVVDLTQNTYIKIQTHFVVDFLPFFLCLRFSYLSILRSIL